MDGKEKFVHNICVTPVMLMMLLGPFHVYVVWSYHNSVAAVIMLGPARVEVEWHVSVFIDRLPEEVGSPWNSVDVVIHYEYVCLAVSLVG